MNKVILVGNLARDPELSTTTGGISVCRMTVAVSRRYASADGTRETDFFNVVVWRAQGENCHKYLRKGSKTGIVGTLQTRSYDDKEGIKRYVTEVVADEVEFLSPKGSGGEYSDDYADSDSQSAPRGKKTVELKPIEDDELPF